LTIISSAHQIALIEDVNGDMSIDEIREKYVKNVDIILSEGYKGNPFPKIEVYRSALKRELLCQKEDNLLAIASDVEINAGVPCFDINDAKNIVGLIENKFLKSRV
jgi:molybdopterin-guanine dinucleotide biosynthesis adapter protein